jgi:hypothetical protein
MNSSTTPRLDALRWNEITDALARDGYALTPPLLNPQHCASLIDSYDDDSLFRSHIVMARFNFGRGEYKYFNYPLPPLVSDLREHLYPHLANIANRWAEGIGGPQYPLLHTKYLDLCHRAGQTKPTPLLLKYEAGDFNCLHQDLYGELSFPFQMTFFLSRRELDYTGGEFVLVEQRPRMQSRAMVVVAEQGQAVIFPTRYRAVQGSRGTYKANLRHGVSPLRSGTRFTLGLIFHDAK